MIYMDKGLFLRLAGGLLATGAGIWALTWVARWKEPNEWLYVGAGTLIAFGISVAGNAFGESIGKDVKNVMGAIAAFVAGVAMYKCSPYSLDFWPAAMGSAVAVLAIFGLVSMFSSRMS